jgi:hypothetical protein
MAEVIDGFVSLLGGMHGGLAPELIKEDLYARGVNVSSRKGLVHTRPRIVLETTFPGGTFQGAETWSLASGDRVVFVISGKLYSASVDTWAVLDHGYLFNASGRCYFCQADRYMVIQDGESNPRVLDASSGTPVVVASTIPIGTIMAYTHGRLHLVPKYVPGTAEPGEMYFISGDVLLPNDPANVLQFTETEYWNEGGAHGIPDELGNIYGLQPFRNASTGTGSGSLVVLGKHGSSAFDVSIPRSKWNSTALSQVLFSGIGTGTVSPFSFKQINDDLVYRGLDGIRLIRYTKTELAGSSGALSCVPSSNEVIPFIESESAEHLPSVSTALADNRVFVTAVGKWVATNDVFSGMIVLDLASVYGMKAAPAPSYDGIWTGVNPRQVLTVTQNNSQKLLIISEDNKVYTLSEAVYKDEGDNETLCRLYTKVMYFPSDRVSLKELKYAELWVSDIYHDVDVTIHFRPEGFPLWSKLGEATIYSAGSAYPQRRRKLRIALSDEAKTYDPETKDALFKSSGFQFCLEWSGNLTLTAVRFAAEAPLAESPKIACNEEALSDTLTVSSSLYELDDFTYDIEA